MGLGGWEEVVSIKGRIERRWQRLASGNKSPSPPATVPVILLLRVLVLDNLLDHLLDVADLYENILGFQVGMNNPAFAVEVVQTHQHLLGDLHDQISWYAPMLPLLDQAE